jgi:hypothetical protein
MTLTQTKQAVSTTLQWLRDGQPPIVLNDPRNELDRLIHHLACSYLEYSFRRRLTPADANFLQAEVLKNLLTPQWDAEWERTVEQAIQNLRELVCNQSPPSV